MRIGPSVGEEVDYDDIEMGDDYWKFIPQWGWAACYKNSHMLPSEMSEDVRYFKWVKGLEP